MSATLVFIFLLEHSTENNQNRTFKEVFLNQTIDLEPSQMKKCDHMITDPLLQIISKELNVFLIPKWMNYKNVTTRTDEEESHRGLNENSSHKKPIDNISDKPYINIFKDEYNLPGMETSDGELDDLIPNKDDTQEYDKNHNLNEDNNSEADELQKNLEEGFTYIDTIMNIDGETSGRRLLTREETVILKKDDIRNDAGNKEDNNITEHETNMNIVHAIEMNLDKSKTEEKQNDTENIHLTEEIANLRNNSAYSEGDPMLVAIFESLDSLTAQTCGGTLLTSEWVLTAASCLGLLSSARINGINATDKSFYTIVVNATNPLIDGTTHFVTEIHLHPETKDFDLDIKFEAIKRNFIRRNDNYEQIKNDAVEIVPDVIINTNNINNSDLKLAEIRNKTDNEDHNTNDVGNSKKYSIALMKIHPPADVNELNIVKVDGALHVLTYAWSMRTDENNGEAVQRMTFKGELLSPSECAKQYKLSDFKDGEPCLASDDIERALHLKVNWGGPILTPTGGLVGVARGDCSAPFGVTLVAPHLDWIKATTNETFLSTHYAPIL